MRVKRRTAPTGALGISRFFALTALLFGSLSIAEVHAGGSTPTSGAGISGQSGVNLACGGIPGGTNLDGLCGATGTFGDNEFSQVSAFNQQALPEAMREVQNEVTGQLTGTNGRLGLVRNLAKLGKSSGFAFNGKQVAFGEGSSQASFRGTGGGAQADSGGLGGKLGAFLNIKYGSGEQDANGTEAGFDFDVIGVLGGVDYRFTDKFIGGIAIGYNRTSSDYIGVASGSEFDINNYSFSVYGSFYPTDAIYLDFLASYGRNDYSTERTFPVAGQQADGDTDGNQFAVSATAGYQFNVKALTFGPYVQANWQRAEVDAYTETGSGFALSVNDQTVKSFTSVVGVSADYAISTSFGIISPSVRVEWEHEFDNDSRVVVAQFASDPGSFMNLATAKPDRDFFNVGFGVSTTLPQGITAFADFEILLGHEDLDNHTITVGARMQF